MTIGIQIALRLQIIKTLTVILPDRNKLIVGYFAFAISALIMVASGLIPDVGHWYSDHTIYRRQTEAFFRSDIAVSQHSSGSAPQWGSIRRDMTWDLVWFNGGVQQPWGLAVPLIRFPFEVLARLLGRSAAPDRLVLGLVLMVVTYAILRIFSPRESPAKEHHKKEFWVPALAVLTLILFPPFLALCRSRFLVYAEASAYAYLTGIGLFLGTLFFFQKPSTIRFLLLSLAAGLAPFVRPTLLFYSGATILVAVVWAWELKWSKWRLASGIALFCLGGGLLFLTNHWRFGSGFEFGHSLNLNSIDAMRYASRFDHPFRTEPLPSATLELTSLLFFSRQDFNGLDWYEEDFFGGQSSTLRWREMYFSTYDISYAILLVGGWSLMIPLIRRRLFKEKIKSRENTSWMPIPPTLLLWSLISFSCLYFFYLRFPFITSRYLLDFGPAIAVALLAFLLFVLQSLEKLSKPRFKWGFSILLTSVFFWWTYQIATFKGVLTPSPVLNYAEVTEKMARMHQDLPSVQSLPGRYETGMDLDEYSIRFNGEGWDTDTGATKAAIALFVDDPQFLELELAPAEDVTLSREGYEIIQAKVGLEFLQLQEMKETPEGMKLTFARPQRKVYQSGLQAAFVAFMTPEELHTGNSRFSLLSVRWKDGPEL